MNIQKMLCIIILLSSGHQCFSQDQTLRCGTGKVYAENGNKQHFDMVVHTPYTEYKNITAIPKTIIVVNHAYLENRVGSSILKKIRFDKCYVIDFEKFDRIKKQKPWISLEQADKRVKYALGYYFLIDGNLKYYFTLVYDKEGNLLSAPQFPDVQKNKQFANIISACEAKKAAEKDNVYKGNAVNLMLAYSDSLNSFTWKIEMPTITKYKQTKIKRFIVLNASDGSLIKRESEEVTSVCDGNTPPLPKL